MILARKIEKSKDFLQIFGMWKHFLDSEFLWNSDKIWCRCSANRRENCKILTMFFENLWQLSDTIRDENLLNCWCRRGAKECKSDKSRQELPNEYLLAKFGYDTAENEPCKVCSIDDAAGRTMWRSPARDLRRLHGGDGRRGWSRRRRGRRPGRALLWATWGG